MRQKKFWEKTGILFLLWLCFIVLSLAIPPMFHRSAESAAVSMKDDGEYQTINIDELDVKENAEKSMESEKTAERALVLDDNTEALLWRLRLIENAQNRIVLSTFEFYNDEAGKDMMAALCHAADRGVQVQVLVDGLSGLLHLKYSSPFRELSLHPNVEVRIYNPVNLLAPWRINYRMHDKYLIMDDDAYILGGRNVGDLFLGEYIEDYNEDLDILVYETETGAGDSYGQLETYFEQIWNLSCCKSYKGRGKAAKELEDRYTSLRQQYPEAYEEVDWLGATWETDGISLLSGETAPKNKAPLLWKNLLDEMAAEKDVIAITPYIICSREMYEDIEKLTADGAEILLLINASENGANPFGCTDYLNQKKRVSETGMTVCEYWGAQSLHTKTILAGEKTSIVGSCNVDIRSVYLDTELMLVIESGRINEELRSYAEKMQSQGVTTMPDGTQRYGDGYREKTMSVGKKALYGVLRILIVPFRHLL